jgi:hypothetical protein
MFDKIRRPKSNDAWRVNFSLKPVHFTCLQPAVSAEVPDFEHHLDGITVAVFPTRLNFMAGLI